MTKHVKQEMRGEANRKAQGSIKDEVQKHEPNKVKREVKSEVLEQPKQHAKKEVKEEEPGKVKQEMKKEVKLEVKTEARPPCHVLGRVFDDVSHGLLGWRIPMSSIFWRYYGTQSRVRLYPPFGV